MPRNRRFHWIHTATEGLPSIGCLPPRQRRRLWKPLPRVLCPLWNPQPTGRSRPYWITQSQRNCHPFGFPARFEMSTHRGKMVCGYSFQNVNNTKIPTVSPPIKREITVGIQCCIHGSLMVSPSHITLTRSRNCICSLPRFPHTGKVKSFVASISHDIPKIQHKRFS